MYKALRGRLTEIVLVAVWALLFLPNLRTNPNWYGDEGEWMEASWTFIQGNPRVGPVNNDHIYPYAYPPLYLLINGALLQTFGYDIAVSRALGAAVALGTCFILLWIGRRLRSRAFGFLCAMTFLVYPEAVINFRWARGHTMAGMIVLASIAFLIRYVQERRLRDVVGAGIMATLATATVYWAYPAMAAVVLTALFVNRRHVLPAIAAAVAFPCLFTLWYGYFHSGGVFQLVTHAALTGALDPSNSMTLAGKAAWLYKNYVDFFLLTTVPLPDGTAYPDVWLIGATAGLLVFPVRPLRKWLVLWTLLMPFALCKRGDNISLFMYSAMVFVPLLAVSVAGFLLWLGNCAGNAVSALGAVPNGLRNRMVSLAPAAVILGAFGMLSLGGSHLHFRTKIDRFAQYSVRDGEAVAHYINAHTGSGDFVIAPKQISWLLKDVKTCMLVSSLNYEGHPSSRWPLIIPKNCFWFDCSWRNAKYIVWTYAKDPVSGKLYGLDAAYTLLMPPVVEVLRTVAGEKWPVVFSQGEYQIAANPKYIPAGAPEKNESQRQPVTSSPPL
jgi:hypothetical protein